MPQHACLRLQFCDRHLKMKTSQRRIKDKAAKNKKILNNAERQAFFVQTDKKIKDQLQTISINQLLNRTSNWRTK